jgi:hypothetical protein
MADRPVDILKELPLAFQWRPRPITWDPIDMEFIISRVDDPQVQKQLIQLRLETISQVLRLTADATQKAAGMIGEQR